MMNIRIIMWLPQIQWGNIYNNSHEITLNPMRYDKCSGSHATYFKSNEIR